MELDDLGRIVRVTDPQIAPDGKSIVVVMSRANFEENRYDADLVIVDVASGSPRTLTQDRRGISQPRFSPSGDRLAFLSAWLRQPASPPGRRSLCCRWVAAIARHECAERGAALRLVAGWPHHRVCHEDEAEKKAGPERFNDSFEVKNDDIFIQSQRLPTHVWSMPADGGEAKRLTSGSWSLPISYPPGATASPLSWSPDGESIALVRLATPHSGDSDRATIHILDVATGQMRGLTGRERLEGQPTFSPDGSQLAYWQPRAAPGSTNEIHVAPTSGVLAGALPGA